MGSERIAELLKLKEFRKLTGPPEHWLTTFNRKFWGLEDKYRNEWEQIQPGDLFVLHSMGTQYLGTKPRVETGIIGVGVTAGTSVKSNPEWIGEFQGKNDWPLLIHFSEIWWFGGATKTSS